MLVRDKASWQARRAVLREDGDVSRAFLEFIEDWASSAEGLGSHVYIDPAEALRDQLPFIEERHARVGAHYLGQMLAVLADHWEFGIEMMQGLTPFERRLVEDMTLIKIAESQASAEGDTQ